MQKFRRETSKNIGVRSASTGPGELVCVARSVWRSVWRYVTMNYVMSTKMAAPRKMHLTTVYLENLTRSYIKKCVTHILQLSHDVKYTTLHVYRRI